MLVTGDRIRACDHIIGAKMVGPGHDAMPSIMFVMFMSLAACITAAGGLICCTTAPFSVLQSPVITGFHEVGLLLHKFVVISSGLFEAFNF